MCRRDPRPPAAGRVRPALHHHRAQDRGGPRADGRSRRERRRARARACNQAPPLGPMHELAKIADLAEAQLKKALDAFVTGDVAKAEEVMRGDDLIDALYLKIFNDMLALMMEDSRNIRRATAHDVRGEAPRALRRPRDEPRRDGRLHGARAGRPAPAEPRARGVAGPVTGAAGRAAPRRRPSPTRPVPEPCVWPPAGGARVRPVRERPSRRRSPRRRSRPRRAWRPRGRSGRPRPRRWRSRRRSPRCPRSRLRRRPRRRPHPRPSRPGGGAGAPRAPARVGHARTAGRDAARRGPGAVPTVPSGAGTVPGGQAAAGAGIVIAPASVAPAVPLAPVAPAAEAPPRLPASVAVPCALAGPEPPASPAAAAPGCCTCATASHGAAASVHTNACLIVASLPDLPGAHARRRGADPACGEAPAGSGDEQARGEPREDAQDRAGADVERVVRAEVDAGEADARREEERERSEARRLAGEGDRDAERRGGVARTGTRSGRGSPRAPRTRRSRRRAARG